MASRHPTGSGKSGYSFSTGAGTPVGGVLVGYTIQATPLSINQTGIRAFCAEEDAVVRVDPAGACSNTEAGILVFNPLTSNSSLASTRGAASVNSMPLFFFDSGYRLSVMGLVT